MKMKIHTEPLFDILVAGAGLAGIRAAVSCAMKGMRVLLATPSRLCSGSSFYPMMDTIHCLCTTGPDDREAFMKDIKDCSWSMNDPWMSRYYVEHIEECLKHMAETGIRCHKLPERKLACFGHTERDLYYWNDWDRLREEVRNVLDRLERITVNFDTVSANALAVFSQWPILPKHCLENASPETLQQDQFWQKPIGSGPFKVDEVVLNNYATLKRWDGYYKTGTGNIETIYMFASGENDSNLVKNAGAGKIDYAWSKSTDDAKAIESMDGMKVSTANIRYTRCFYINQFPHEPNIK